MIKEDKSDIRSTNDSLRSAPFQVIESALFISESACLSPQGNDGTCETFIQAHNYLIAQPESCGEGFSSITGKNGWIGEDKSRECET